MKFYNKYFENNYKELLTYYPRFYRDVFEMAELLKAHGRIADELEGNIEQTYLNCFIDYADEETLAKLEKFLMIGPLRGYSLEARRRLVKSYFVGFGKVSAGMVREIVYSCTGMRAEVLFEPFDAERNNQLFINFEKEADPVAFLRDLRKIFNRKLPAHIPYQIVARAGGEYKVELRYRNQLRMASEFYSRLNLEYLLLDGSWELGGQYLLGMYKTGSYTDAYPVTVSIRGGVTPGKNIWSRQAVCGDVTGRPALQERQTCTTLCYSSQKYDSQATLITAYRAEANVESGLQIEKNLWYLNGEQMLDGDCELNAEIIACEI